MIITFYSLMKGEFYLYECVSDYFTCCLLSMYCAVTKSIHCVHTETALGILARKININTEILHNMSAGRGPAGIPECSPLMLT